LILFFYGRLLLKVLNISESGQTVTFAASTEKKAWPLCTASDLRPPDASTGLSLALLYSSCPITKVSHPGDRGGGGGYSGGGGGYGGGRGGGGYGGDRGGGGGYGGQQGGYGGGGGGYSGGGGGYGGGGY
jgi:hypothetical protein